MGQQLRTLWTCKAYDAGNNLIYTTELWAFNEPGAQLDFELILKACFPQAVKISLAEQPSIFKS